MCFYNPRFSWREIAQESAPNLLWPKGDFYSLGVLIRLLTRSKILDVVSFLQCVQIIFSLKSHSLTLTSHMDLPSYPICGLQGYCLI